VAVTALIFVFVLLVAVPLLAQSSATLQGHVVDRSGGTVTGAAITLRSLSMEFDASVHTDSEGRYLVAEIPAGTYALEAAAAGFRSEVVELLVLNVGRSAVRDFRLDIGEQREAVVVTAEIPLIDRATTVVGRRDRTNRARGPIEWSPLHRSRAARAGLEGLDMNSLVLSDRTRFPTGEAGSSRQIQLALKAWF